LQHVLFYNLFIFLESSKDYLETKKRILDLRAKFGENNWLSSHAGTFVQDIMGLHPVPQSSESQISKIQTLQADINTASSLHDTLIYAMDNRKYSESQGITEVVEYTEDDKEILPNETLNNLPKTCAAPMIVYDPNEGKSYAKLMQNIY